MQKILPLFLIVACSAASAQVYKRIGADGKIYFSDRPGPDAIQVEVAPAQAVSMPPLPEQLEEESDESSELNKDVGPSYTRFDISSPSEDEGVRANDGNVTVQLVLQPSLAPGHTIVLSVDGEDGESSVSASGLTVRLGNLSRGLHTVQARVLDENGKVMILTKPVSFNVLRFAGG